jgi:pyrimidine-nucleoside phosphorylase
MSKKLALGTDGIVLDVKTGSGAFMRKLEDSIELCKTMVITGEKSGRTTIGLITDMDQPLGNHVGNSLEIIESIEALKGNGPDDLMTVTYGLGAAMLIAAGVEKDYMTAMQRLEKTLVSGEPLNIFRKFIAAQNGNANVCDDYSLFPQVKHQTVFPAEKTGYITGMDAYEIGMAAIETGAGRKKKEDNIDYGAGFVFHKKIGAAVKKDEPILTIYCDNIECLASTTERLKKAIVISDKIAAKPKMIHFLVDKNGLRNFQEFPITYPDV